MDVRLARWRDGGDKTKGKNCSPRNCGLYFKDSKPQTQFTVLASAAPPTSQGDLLQTYTIQNLGRLYNHICVGDLADASYRWACPLYLGKEQSLSLSGDEPLSNELGPVGLNSDLMKRVSLLVSRVSTPLQMFAAVTPQPTLARPNLVPSQFFSLLEVVCHHHCLLPTNKQRNVDLPLKLALY